MRRSIPAISAVLLLLGALTGCTDDPKPIEPTGSPTAIPVPTMPVQASEDSVEGRAAFAKYWFELLNFVAMTGDTKPVVELATNCKPCAQLAADTAAVRWEGRRLTEPFLQVTRLEPYGAGAVHIRVYIAGNDKYAVRPHTMGILTSARPPFSALDVWQVAE